MIAPMSASMPSPISVVLLYVTTADPDAARSLARTLLEERLCACANILPGMLALYRWDGMMQEESQAVLIVKTTAALAGAARERLVELHADIVPCVLELPVQGGHQPFLEWVGGETGQG